MNAPANGNSLIPGFYYREAAVENANRMSNAILLSYPVSDAINSNALRWRPGGWPYHP